MSTSLSMKTSLLSSKHKKWVMRWRLQKTPSGETKFIPIKKKEPKVLNGGTIHATLTTKMIQFEKIPKAVEMISDAGGSVSSVRGKKMLIEVEDENVESVGEVLDSFGCQWDLY